MRAKIFLRVLATIALASFSRPAQAEEKNGLLVTVTKKTLEHNETRTLASSRQDRTQGLALMVKNNSIKDFPAGEVRWTIVVRKSYEGGSQKYSGKEVLKALRPSASLELVLGAAQTTGYRFEYSSTYKDKLEYEVVITHNGKETLRTASDTNFAALAEQAISMDRETEEPAARPAPIVTPIRVRPQPADIKPAPAPTPPGITPKNNLPPKPAPTPTTPPAAAPADSTPPDAAPPATAPSGKPFDFFNLDKGKK